MASVKSLGLHRPAGLRHAIDEQMLPADAPPSSYTWEITTDEEDGVEVEDELLTTKSCVVWSRGGIVRKAYKFDLEKEPVIQALLSYFPTSEDDHSLGGFGPGSTGAGKLAKALVVFLKSQAHIYFLSGTSHVVHMPFEVESACAAPQGVVVQRRQRAEPLAALSLKFPRVPPNSFVSSQLTAPSPRSSQTAFSVEGLGKPKTLPLGLNSTLGSLWDPPPEQVGGHWPRLVALTDPLLELGLVVTQKESATRENKKLHARKSALFLSPAEEILHIEQVRHPELLKGADPLILAVTINRESSHYTVWRLSYIKNEDPFIGQLRKKSKPDRRRSSMQPSFLGSSATPVQPSFRESFGAPLPGKRQQRKSEKIEQRAEAPLDFVSSLDPDRDKEGGAARRTSRRVSSMLARADLSVDRNVFAEQPLLPGHGGNSKRMDSHGSHHRFSGVGVGGGRGSLVYGQTIHPSLGSLLEAPLDSVLDEGLHNMGLDDHDFDGLVQEMMFTEVHSMSLDSSNVRYSLSSRPARSQCKVFVLVAPVFATDDQQRSQIVVCIQDPAEKRLHILPLQLERKTADQFLQPGKKGVTRANDPAVGVAVAPGQVRQVLSVVDSCRVADGDISAILILSETMDGRREMSLQAPWSELTRISIPLLLRDDVRSIHYEGREKDRDARQKKTETIDIDNGNINGLLHPRARGVVDLVDAEYRLHQLRIQLAPLSCQVRTVLDACRSILPPGFGERMVAGWWHAMQWLAEEDLEVADREWSCLVVEVLAFFLALGRPNTASTVARPTSKKRRVPSGSFGSVEELEDWKTLQLYETRNSAGCPRWMLGRAWQWTMDEEEVQRQDGRVGSSALLTKTGFMAHHVQYARLFMASALGTKATGESGYLPTAPSKATENRHSAAWALFMGLHLLLEEQKLDIMAPEYLSPGRADLRVLLCQIARWMRWNDLVATYELGIQEELDPALDSELVLSPPIPQLPPQATSVLDWILANLVARQRDRILTLPDIYYAASKATPHDRLKDSRWNRITPRTLMFHKLFSQLHTTATSPAHFIEAMFSCGIDAQTLETLPEAVLIPIRDAIAACQPHPPAAWSRELLELVNRSDISLALSSEKVLRHPVPNILAPSHTASRDFRMLCQTVDEANSVGYDEGDGTERQAVIRALFKDDRRLNEAQDLLSTHKARVVRLDHQERWTESEYLERQKELVARVATGTLAIPPGRALLFYSLRFPLLTQKFHIGGFNLNCIVRPTGVTVGVDKSQFTEEKVCWGFFHQGVAAGLAISPNAKGIDTSWILYNKPGQDLSNRHAGFLLALGLNGHLKDVAKWVAFKYLTPKHTMTSIGLLLGLAASYLGTMDSLITRLLSVHVTRMLPRGAAELNLSPLTQTTGIMGIGLLYCRSQHRRMSEIMLSEIVHTDEEDEEEPLRSECYRLAAGFALGLINLAKGTDLKGLHDMRLAEQLVAAATATKKVELVHVLDRAAAGAVVAVTLIYMKSEDHMVARKIDVPESVLQFDYVRPDILLLRTLAKNLILWSRIEATPAWIVDNLPEAYRHRHRLTGVNSLRSTDLPFFSITAGLCFAMALRFAGSASVRVRDLLVHYLDQFMRITRLPPSAGRAAHADPEAPPVYDEELARSTARMCQDVLALSAAVVMAGTGDVAVLRRLRALHGRHDAETPYGSHLAAHLAVGALFLGCGTATFGTGDLAVASLLAAFYPVFPTSVMDNRSHLQAFRHFWVLATDPRCLVAKDVATGQPVSVPVHIRLRAPLEGGTLATGGDEDVLVRQTPCLLPPLDEVAALRTDAGPAFWDIEVDLDREPRLAARLRESQTLYLRRRPGQEAPFAATLRALGRGAVADALGAEGAGAGARDPVEWVFELEALAGLTRAERGLVLDRGEGGGEEAAGTAVDARLVLERAAVEGVSRERLEGLRLLFEWADQRAEVLGGGARDGEAMGEAGKESQGKQKDKSGEDRPWWMRDSVVESLKGRVWLAGREGQTGRTG